MDKAKKFIKDTRKENFLNGSNEENASQSPLFRDQDMVAAGV